MKHVFFAAAVCAAIGMSSATAAEQCAPRLGGMTPTSVETGKPTMGKPEFSSYGVAGARVQHATLAERDAFERDPNRIAGTNDGSARIYRLYFELIGDVGTPNHGPVFPPPLPAAKIGT